MVRGTLVASETTREVWDMVMVVKTNHDREDGTETVYSTIQGVTLARPPLLREASSSSSSSSSCWLDPTEPLMVAADPADAAQDSSSYYYTVKQSIPTYRDEFDPHLPSHLSLANVFNFWERTRTNSLGGPNALERLQNQDGMLVVVTGYRDVTLVDHDQDALIPGESIEIVTVIDAGGRRKRKRARLDFVHTAYSRGQRIAQGIATCLVIDKTTKRPVRQLPDWVMRNVAENSSVLE